MEASRFHNTGQIVQEAKHSALRDIGRQLTSATRCQNATPPTDALNTHARQVTVQFPSPSMRIDVLTEIG